jgi:hypothetical protein
MKLSNACPGLRSIHVISPKRLIAVCAVVLAIAASLVSQTTPRANRITQELTSGPIVTLAGSVHHLTQRATDMGAVNSDMQMDSLALNIGLSATQQTELNALIGAQQDTKSPQYHQWLTQEDFGARFGLTDADMSKVTRWLEAQGFKVKSVAISRNAIAFSGKAWQVEQAFHTQLRLYKLNGETHFSNATELRIPAGLASVVTSVRGLSSFRPKPLSIAKTAKPEFTSYLSGSHFLSPGDWATIYDVSQIYVGGNTGSGMHVGIAGQTYFPQADIDKFRAAAGLGATMLNMVCISSSNCTGTAGESVGDVAEADLDVEWAGGIAQGATVDFIYASAADPYQGAFDALYYGITTYQVNGAVVPVISVSYANCELDLGAGYVASAETYLQQATAQGQTILNSSGDAGAAGCDYDATISTQGAVVDWPASSPNVTGVGGTRFSGDGSDTGADAYWSASSTADIISSALQYIPETSWNDTSADQASNPASTLSSSGGGVSLFNGQPTWQATPNNYSGTSMRFVPDVSFAASADHDGYLVCTQNFTSTTDPSQTTGSTCVNGFRDSDMDLTVYGGTSASTPSFAGMLTLLVQKYGNLGNINPTLYSMAADSTIYATVFHDITTGDNKQPCSGGAGCSGGLVGYSATTGYDLVTGLGSIDGGALFAALAPASLAAPTTTTVTATPSSVTIGGTAAVSATVASTRAGTPTGTVTFTVGSTTIGTAAVSGGTATLNATASVANGFSVGSETITASYGGDANCAASTAATPLTVVLPLPTTTTVTATPSSETIGGTTTLSAVVSSTAAGTLTGTVTFTAGGQTLGMASISGGTAAVSGIAVTAVNGFTVGSDSITANYSGNATFGTSSGSSALTVAAAPSTTTLTATPSSVAIGSTTTLSATVSPSSATGTVTFKVGSTTLGTATLSSGTAALSNVTVSTVNGFSTGSDSITANYSGDATFGTSSGSSTLTVAATPAYTLVPSATSITNSARSGDSVTLSLTSTDYAGTVSFTTSVSSTNGTASNVSASAPSVTLTKGGNRISELTITATANAANHAPVAPWTSGGAVVFGAVLLGAPFMARRKRVLAVLLTGAVISLAGFSIACSGGTGRTVKSARIYTVTVTPAGSGTVTNPVPVSVTVTVQ